jgi:glucose/arabinose dehydrogenase
MPRWHPPAQHRVGLRRVLGDARDVRRAARLLAAAVVAAASLAGPKAPPARSNESAHAAAGGVRLVTIGRFHWPTYVAAAPGDRRRLFVVERAGVIRVLRGGRTLPRPFLDIRRRVGTVGEGGLLSMAFSPDFRRSGRFYVFYTDRAGDIRVDEFRRRGADRALPSSRRRVLFQRHPGTNHKGGQLQFGPDGMLYVGLGDGGGVGDPGANAQDLGTLLGKVLRIDPRPRRARADDLPPPRARGYRIPQGNPFVGLSGARPEVYAYGLRNPYRFSFDRPSGDLVIADVGEYSVEEVNFVVNEPGGGRTPDGGYNFGWNVFEGSRPYRDGSAPGHVPPVIERPHRGPCAVIGGYVVRDRSLRGLYGRYVYGDFCDPELRLATLEPGKAVGDRALGVRIESQSSFGEDARRRLYVTSLDGPVYRLAPG